VKVQLAGRAWHWDKSDTACFKYLSEHWGEALAPLQVVPSSRRSLCVQAGGNFGVWPWLLSMHFDRVVTFEPDPGCYALLQKNIADRNNIESYRVGLADRATQADLVNLGRNRGAQHLRFGEGSIPCIALDDMKLPALDLLALDIEGAEHFALEGAKATIDLFRPYIVVEDWREPPKSYKRAGKEYPGHAKKNYDLDVDAKDWLQSRGYRSVMRVGQDEIYAP
jgi:FkbM family methyltransferase